MAQQDALLSAVSTALAGINHTVDADGHDVELRLERGDIVAAATALRDNSGCRFEQLIDLCGVDYGAYGIEQTTLASEDLNNVDRFAVVYQLLSVTHNRRLRVKCFVDSSFPLIDSVTEVWASADWFEREAFDFFGIVFEGHPDLRRLLTDYGFIGHPFRKDFPVSGYVEMRYDPDKGRVVYEPVSIDPRVLVPRKIRPETFSD